MTADEEIWRRFGGGGVTLENVIEIVVEKKNTHISNKIPNATTIVNKIKSNSATNENVVSRCDASLWMYWNRKAGSFLLYAEVFNTFGCKYQDVKAENSDLLSH